MQQPPVLIVGSGPAGLMAATVVARAGYPVRIFEKKKGPGRKLLIAGSSGLNITYEAPLDEFARFYDAPKHLEPQLKAFPPSQWIAFIEKLGLKTFKGTSRRYFVENMKASVLLREWLAELDRLGATISFEKECVAIESSKHEVSLRFADGETVKGAAACLAMGGATYVPEEKPLHWPKLFESHGIRLAPFRSSNAGYQVLWPEGLVKEAEREPVKNVTLTTSKGSKTGDLLVTDYGLEGTPVYHVGTPGPAHLDLKPDLTLEDVEARLTPTKEKLAPIRLAKKALKLAPAAHALLFHLTTEADRADRARLAQKIKRLPLELAAPRPLDEAISSSGGIKWDELDENLMLKRLANVYVAGEMIDWDAPTGGFLIQACVSQGFVAGTAIVNKAKGT